MIRTIGKVYQIEAFGGRRLSELLQPKLSCSFRMASVMEHIVSTDHRHHGAVLPVEHDPLRDSDDTLLGLVQSREFGLHCIIGI